ncbi:MAG: GntR family transcriptional regulator [Planctomycetota bacterium]|nr:GntR family transcriptional regulator [Planctomycetota bacterium]
MTAADVAYLGIREMLASGELVPGQRLSQSRLARQLQCSPMPVVEAMRRLESEGLLDKQARKQARVRKLSREDLDGLYLLREAIETVIARLAAERINSEESQTLRELAQAYEHAWEVTHHESEVDIAIHRHIAACARCPLLQQELERFRLIELTAGRHLRATLTRPGHPHIHRALVQAIVDHDAQSAEYLMKGHIQHGYDEMRREFEEQQRLGKSRLKKE